MGRSRQAGRASARRIRLNSKQLHDHRTDALVQRLSAPPPRAEALRSQALPLAYFPWLVGILLAYCVLTTLIKRFYIRRFGWQ